MQTQPAFQLILDYDGMDKRYAYGTERDARDQFKSFKSDPKTFSAVLMVDRPSYKAPIILDSFER